MYTLVTPAAVEPISLDEAKVVCAVDAGITGEDAHIEHLVRTAREHVQGLLAEAGNPLRLAPETWRRTLAFWPRTPWIDLAVLPVVEVQEVAYQDADNPSVLAVLPDEEFYLDATNVRLHHAGAWPTKTLGPMGLRVTFAAGYATAPQPLVQAMFTLVAHWFENREAVVAGTQYRAEAVKVPIGFDDLLAPYLVRRVA